ncbi:MAG: bifunctional nuclease family protein [Bacteroidetes bacterium]|nr:bifunctional nuclease family protein [Bacteroidota bacterium]
MQHIRLEIIGMSYSQSQSGAYALILGEIGGDRRLPIIIGGFEAQSIAIELEKMKPSRPLTHDLFKNFADHYGVTIKHVIIDKFELGVFFAKLICVNDNIESEIDARTSDAVALAIRFKCPIYTNEKLLTEAGVLLDETKTAGLKEKKVNVKTHDSDYADYTLSDLNKMLKEAIDNEEYEKASVIRDEIQRKKKS